MKKGYKIAIVVVLVLVLAGVIYWALRSKKSAKDLITTTDPALKSTLEAIIDSVDSNWKAELVTRSKASGLSVEQQLIAEAIWLVNQPGWWSEQYKAKGGTQDIGSVKQ